MKKKFNFDPNYYWHYLIGLRRYYKPSTLDPPELVLRYGYGPVEFTNNDIINLWQSIVLSKDKLIKNTTRESTAVFGVSELVDTVRVLLLMGRYNPDTTFHHFSSESQLSEEFFVELVRSANTSKHSLELLKQSII